MINNKNNKNKTVNNNSSSSSNDNKNDNLRRNDLLEYGKEINLKKHYSKKKWIINV